MGVRVLRGVDLDVRAGEIVGLAGVAGNGQRELAEVVVGLRHGPRRACGPPRAPTSQDGRPRRRIEAGIGYVPEDKLGQGVAASAFPSPTTSSAKRYRSLAGLGPLPAVAGRTRGGKPRSWCGASTSAAPRLDAPAGGPLGRQPAEARARPRALRGTRLGPRRLAPDPRARRRRRGDRSAAAARAAGDRGRGARDQRGPRRALRAVRPPGGHLRGPDHRRLRLPMRSTWTTIGLRMAGPDARVRPSTGALRIVAVQIGAIAVGLVISSLVLALDRSVPGGRRS